MSERAAFNGSASRNQMQEQSKVVSSHLCGLVLKLSASSTPRKWWRCSGSIAATPACAPSTCSLHARDYQSAAGRLTVLYCP